jgi:hypothetical protein
MQGTRYGIHLVRSFVGVCGGDLGESCLLREVIGDLHGSGVVKWLRHLVLKASIASDDQMTTTRSYHHTALCSIAYKLGNDNSTARSVDCKCLRWASWQER